MARVRRRRSFRQGSGQKRPTWWARHHAQGSLAANTKAANNLLAEYQSARGITSIDPGTTLAGGWVNLLVSSTAVTPLTARVGFGIIVVDENTAAQVPDPFADMHVDWLYYRQGRLALDTQTTLSFLIDQDKIGSQRRMDEIGMNVYGVLIAQAAVDYNLDTSLLLRLR